MATPSTDHSPIHVLLVGQIYLDTILEVDHFPEEDHKLRARRMEQRRGGNCGNTAELLAQFPGISVSLMSALGAKETCGTLISQFEAKGIKTRACLFRENSAMPSSYIIHSLATGSRTIISCSTIEDITLDEFARQFEMARWVHFEGRNIDQVVQQIDWLDAKASRENWRSLLTISVELEKPDRENIDLLMPRGDIVFFSKLFAERRGYTDPAAFLRSVRQQCKPTAVLFCTWGAQGAACLLPDGQVLRAPAIHVPRVVDAVGAGDTFIAGIVFAMSRGMDTMTSLRFASELASRKVAQSGFSGLAQLMAETWDIS